MKEIGEEENQRPRKDKIANQNLKTCRRKRKRNLETLDACKLEKYEMTVK